MEIIANDQGNRTTPSYVGFTDIFTQDQIGVAYLLNSKGEIRWKRDLTDPVIGTPQLIDLYNNNKTQLLVTTRKAIHVIDINGNSPKGFPIQLNETTEIEASFFDYDNDGKIRILVPLSSGIVANYNKDGQAVKGWKFTEGVASPSTPIKHFKLGTTDYITHTSKDGTILLYNRKGNLKSNPFKLGNYAGGTVFVFPSGNSIDRTKFIYRSKSNRLYSQTYKHKPDSLNFTHDLLEIYDYKDADGDGTKDIVGRTSSGIATFSSSGIVMTEFKTSLIPEMEPTLLHFSAAKNYVGLLSEGKVYFLNAFGEVVKGFPISGESVFSVSNLRGGNSFYLITGKGNNLIIEELGM